MKPSRVSASLAEACEKCWEIHVADKELPGGGWDLRITDKPPASEVAAGKQANAEMEGVRDYAEEYPVSLVTHENGRLVVVAKNEGGYNFTQVDLLDLLQWLKANRPDVLPA